MDLVSIIGIAASLFTAVALVPQLIKLLREKKAENISLGMLFILFAGQALWIYYGILKNDLIIVISNSLSFLINCILGTFAFKYKSK